MAYPKLVIVSDGEHTAALLDGIFLGPKIERLEFSADATSGTPKATIRLLEVDVESFQAERGEERFRKMFEALGEE